MTSLDYNPELRTIRLGDVPIAPGTPSSREDEQPPFPSAPPGAFYSTSAVCSVSPFTNCFERSSHWQLSEKFTTISGVHV
jgi:hypothetical protein